MLPIISGPSVAPSLVTPSLRLVAGDRIVMVGDSITTIAFSGVAYWWRFLSTSVLGTLGTYVIEANGLLTGSALSFFDSGHSGGSLQYCYDNRQTQVFDKTPTALILMIGTNDSDPMVYVEATWNALLDTYLNAIYTALPNIKVMLAGPWLSGSVRPDGSNTNDTNLTKIVNKMKAAATARSIPHADLRAEYFASGDTPALLTADGVHPTTLAAQRMSAVALRHITVG